METFRHPRTMRNSRKRRFSREHRQKLSEARKGQKPALGMQHSASTRKRLSEADQRQPESNVGKEAHIESPRTYESCMARQKNLERATEKSAPSSD